MLRPASERKLTHVRKTPAPASSNYPGTGGSLKISKTMGYVHANIKIFNGEDLILQKKGYLDKDEVRQMDTTFLVDTGAYMLTINENIRRQLGLPTLEIRTAELANGDIIECDVVGPVEIRFDNRSSWLSAMVLPNDAEPLLGAIPMEDMDLVVEPRSQRLMVNPAHPDAAQMPLK